jgi:hypothetical protein
MLLLSWPMILLLGLQLKGRAMTWLPETKEVKEVRLNIIRTGWDIVTTLNFVEGCSLIKLWS